MYADVRPFRHDPYIFEKLHSKILSNRIQSYQGSWNFWPVVSEFI